MKRPTRLAALRREVRELRDEVARLRAELAARQPQYVPAQPYYPWPPLPPVYGTGTADAMPPNPSVWCAAGPAANACAPMPLVTFAANAPDYGVHVVPGALAAGCAPGPGAFGFVNTSGTP
jgi:hypothetical protein